MVYTMTKKHGLHNLYVSYDVSKRFTFCVFTFCGRLDSDVKCCTLSNRTFVSSIFHTLGVDNLRRRSLGNTNFSVLNRLTLSRFGTMPKHLAMFETWLLVATCHHPAVSWRLVQQTIVATTRRTKDYG